MQANAERSNSRKLCKTSDQVYGYEIMNELKRRQVQDRGKKSKALARTGGKRVRHWSGPGGTGQDRWEKGQGTGQDRGERTRYWLVQGKKG